MLICLFCLKLSFLTIFGKKGQIITEQITTDKELKSPKQPLGKEPFRRWEPFGIHNLSGFPNRIPAISLKNVQVGAVPSSTVYLQPL